MKSISAFREGSAPVPGGIQIVFVLEIFPFEACSLSYSITKLIEEKPGGIFVCFFISLLYAYKLGVLVRNSPLKQLSKAD